jgi:hypothetical protein
LQLEVRIFQILGVLKEDFEDCWGVGSLKYGLEDLGSLGWHILLFISRTQNLAQ